MNVEVDLNYVRIRVPLALPHDAAPAMPQGCEHFEPVADAARQQVVLLAQLDRDEDEVVHGIAECVDRDQLHQALEPACGGPLEWRPDDHEVRDWGDVMWGGTWHRIGDAPVHLSAGDMHVQGRLRVALCFDQSHQHDVPRFDRCTLSTWVHLDEPHMDDNHELEHK